MKKIVPFLFILIFISNPCKLFSQNSELLTTEELENYRKQVSNLVKYLEGTLNFLGDPEQVNIEKEIIINESFLKIFKDDKVQVEDDLDENREVPLHKDVQAYLKDVIFFYRQAKFEFEIADISHFAKEDNFHYFRVSFNRMLEGITITGDSVQSRKARFMEVNLDISSNDLKIASIYTTKLNEKEEARQWWINLSLEWKKIFGQGVMITDSIELADVSYFTDSLVITFNEQIQDLSLVDTTLNYDIELPDERQTLSNTISSYDTVYMDTKTVYSKLSGILKQSKLDISDNEQIRKLDPVSELSELKELNCSNTLISSLFPIRNLNRLEILDFSDTPVDDLSPLNYSTTLKELNCSFTLISDLSSISGLVNLESLECNGIKITDLAFTENMQKLKTLDCSDTRIIELSPLKHLGALESFDISETKITNLDSIVYAGTLKYLNCENSSITSIEPLGKLENLEVLRISNTEINNLISLNEAENLRKIYCDNSGIAQNDAIQFMRDNPGCLVIFESEELLSGWKELESEWKEILMELGNISENPTKEELHSLLKIEELDISGNRNITYLNPVRKLYYLSSLNISSVNVEDYSPVGEAIMLKWLDISNTNLESVDFLSNLSRLQELRIENTSVSSLETLQGLKNLKYIYADNSKINDNSAFKFRQENPDCIVIYKTGELEKWWNNLPDAWKEYFSDIYTLETPPSKENLHQLLFIDSLQISDRKQINDLSSVTMLRGLKSISFTGTQINNLQPLSRLQNLKAIICNQNPVSDLTSLSGLNTLTHVNIENTPVSDLRPLANLNRLKEINFSGTQVSNLKPLSNLVKLEVVKLNNTAIKNIKFLQNLPDLKTLECYNTRISAKNVDKFKTAKPGCEVVYY